MSKLYEITNNYTAALDDMLSNGFDESIIDDTLADKVDDFNKKCESTASWALNQIAVSEAKKEAAKRLLDQAKSLETAANKCIDYLDHQMQKMKVENISTQYFDMEYNKLPDIIEVVDEKIIPEEFIKTKTTKTIDKAGAKKLLQNNQSIDGFKLVKDRRKLVFK